MKKTLIALAVLASSGAAMAQSSVTLFGIIDAGVARTSATGNGHATGLVFGGSSTSRLGFRGTEDLGGGLAASFWLEGQLANDNGSGASASGASFDFTRRSTVSLAGNFGEIRLGRDFAASYLSMSAFDVYGQRGLGSIESSYAPAAAATSATTSVPATTASSRLDTNRVSNSVAYFLPATLGGFYGNVQYSFGERNSNQVTSVVVPAAPGVAPGSSKTGNYFGARGGYANGPLDVAISYGKFSDVVRAGGIADYTVGNIGASYDFGVVKPMVLLQQEKSDAIGAGPEFKFNTYALGVTAPIGAGLIRANIVRYDNKTSGADANDATKYAIGYVYNLSKRTSLYADVARVNNKGAATFTFAGLGGSVTTPAPTAGNNATAYVVGVKHSF